VRGVAGLWDDSLYAGSAAFYAVGRLPYPQRLAEELQQRVPLDGRGRLLDLGCGPGSLTLLLAPLFGRAVGVDADSDMLRVARTRADQLKIENVEWLHCRAEDLDADFDSFDLVTLAQSFHWMDQPVVAATILRVLTPGGCCVHVGATTHEGVAGAGGLPYPAPPRDEITALVQQYLGPHRRAGQQIVTEESPSDEDAVFRSAGFDGPQRVEVPAGQVFVRTEDEVVASVLSLSSAAPHHFGLRLPEFEADLRALLRVHSPDHLFAERQRDITLSLWRTRTVAS
jgi:SAM-dependent methyltransferase